MGAATRTAAARTLAIRAGIAVAFAATAGAGWAVLAGVPTLGGWLAMSAAVSSAAVSVLVRGGGTTLDRVLASIAERAFDGAVLGSIVWVERDGAPITSLGALVALGAGFLAAYIYAKGRSLGYTIDAEPATRALHAGLVALGLIAGWSSWTVWAAAAVSFVAVLLQSGRVAQQERA